MRNALRLFVLAFAIVAPTWLMAEARLKVVATTGMIADAARVIGGEQVEVHALMGPGVDPHAYRQTRSDIVAMANADLVLWNGLYLEAQMEDFLLDLQDRTLVVAVAEAIPEERLIAHLDYEGRFDPHVWMDPSLWTLVVAEIERSLSTARPDQAEAFQANAAAYRAELATLADEARATLAAVPAENRVLVTAHDAFGYFGLAYDFEVEGIQGLSTESEAGVQQITRLVDRLVTENIPAVFVETSVSDRNIRALLEGAAAQDHEVALGGELYSDAMGEAGSDAETYLGMMRHNVRVIAEALGTNAASITN